MSSNESLHFFRIGIHHFHTFRKVEKFGKARRQFRLSPDSFFDRLGEFCWQRRFQAKERLRAPKLQTRRNAVGSVRVDENAVFLRNVPYRGETIGVRRRSCEPPLPF